MDDKKELKPKVKKDPDEIKSLPFDKYVVVEMDRRDLKGADYNPRLITDKERSKLKALLKRHGMVQPPVFNKQTQTLVGGHQRLAQLDALNGSPNYTLKVAVIDVDLSIEKEINVALNNQQAAGDWDLEKLDSLFRDTTVELVGTGFDMADVYRLLGDAPGRSAEEIGELADSLRSAREQYEKTTASTSTRDNVDFYLVVVFRGAPERKKFLDSLGLDDNRFQDGGLLQAMLKSPEPESAEVDQGAGVNA